MLERLISHNVLVWVSIGSGVALVLSALAIPFVIIRLPTDYLIDNDRKTWLDRQPPLVRGTFRVAKNLFGIVLVLLGVIMLVLPGQGILSIVLGISLVDFPGRRRWQCRLVRRPKVIGGLNWIRKKFHRPPFTVPQTC